MSRVEVANRTLTTYAGVKPGFFHMFTLSYFDITKSLNWEAFHVLYNNSKYMLELLKNKRAKNVNVIRWARETKTYQHFFEKDVISPWVIEEKYQFYIDAVINSIQIPKGYKDSYNAKNMFQQTGNLRGTIIIIVMSTSINIIMISLMIY